MSSGHKQIRKIPNYYGLLGETCYLIRKKEKIERMVKDNKSGESDDAYRQSLYTAYKEYAVSTDVGDGNHPRFLISHTPVFTRDVVDSTVEMLLALCNEMNERMKRTTKDIETLHLVQFFTCKCQDIPGIGPLRGQMMVQLFALFGLVPLQYYTFIPMHLKGGPGTFMEEEMRWDKLSGKNLFEWNAGIVNEMQALYNKEFTYNMFENAACEISRNDVRDDLYFAIPTVSDDGTSKPRLNLDFKSRRMQFNFRVDGNRCNNWILQMYAGGKNKINVYPPTKGKGPSILEWTKARSNGLLSRTTKVRVNLSYLWTLDKARCNSMNI